MSEEMKLPDLGEGVESGTVAKILVSTGDSIGLEQPVIEMETDKAAFEVPSSVEGVVDEIFVAVGDEVAVGEKILSVKAGSASQTKDTTATGSEEKTAPETDEAKPERETADAGDGSDAADESSRHRDADEESGDGGKPPAGESHRDAGEAPEADGEKDDTRDEKERQAGARKPAAPAAPSVRRFAREIGVDIDTVKGSGTAGRISIEDVKSHSKRLHQQRSGGDTLRGGGEKLPDFSTWGDTEIRSMSKIRQTTAFHLEHAWQTIPHVTHFERADVTRLEEVRTKYKGKTEAAGGKLTVTALLVKIAAGALKVFPEFNASVDMDSREIIYRNYFNIGVAVDTDRGLLVPVIRDVGCKNIIDISVELMQLAEKARDRSISLDEMRGGCFTISNLGGIGGAGFAPVVNWPEVAILGVARTRIEPVFIDGSFEPRPIMPLALSYDHRLIDGAAAARFMSWMVEAIENPLLVMLEG